jgi:hypothetical protein
VLLWNGYVVGQVRDLVQKCTWCEMRRVGCTDGKEKGKRR